MSIADHPSTKIRRPLANDWQQFSAATLLQDAAEPFTDPRSVNPMPSGTVYRVMILAPAADQLSFGKSYWQASAPTSSQLTECFVERTIAVEGSVDQIGFPGDAIATTVRWPDLWTKPLLDPPRARGLVTVNHEKTTLFETPVELRTAALPRRKPFIVDYRGSRDFSDD